VLVSFVTQGSSFGVLKTGCAISITFFKMMAHKIFERHLGTETTFIQHAGRASLLMQIARWYNNLFSAI
jgi:hypothetical protein